jgi:CBS domain-containing membrane protein
LLEIRNLLWPGSVLSTYLLGPLAMLAAAMLSILGMFTLRYLQPPAVAAVLFAALSQTMGFRFTFPPVFTDSVLLILAGAVYSNLTGKSYPNRPK